MRSGIKYFGTDTSSATAFTTHFPPAIDLRAVFVGDGRDILVNFHYVLTSPIVGKGIARMHWGPGGTSLQMISRGCVAAGDGRENCVSHDEFDVRDRERLGYQELKRGNEYHFRITLFNFVYDKDFGDQQTGTLTLRAGDTFRHEVFEQPRTAPQ